jgi:hypothetical protein
MTINPSHPTPSAPHRRVTLIIWAAACIISFLLGFWISDRRLAKKVSESAQGQIKEFVMFCDRLGCLDRDKLDEALIEAKAAMDDN